MGNKKVAYFDSDGGAIKEMNGSEVEFITETLLADFNSSDTGTGTVSVNPSSTTGLTLIGTFTDTKRDDPPGTHPVAGTDITSTTFNFYQDLQSATENISVRPMMVTDDNHLQRMPDSDVNVGFIKDTQQDYVMTELFPDAYGSVFGVGSYKMQPTAPTEGTWVEKATITNTLQDGTTNSTKLWRKSAHSFGSRTERRPLKYVAGNVSLRRMSDTEIKQYTPRLRNQIRQGIGQYKLQATAPTTGGTWVAAGQAFTDTRFEIANQNYTTQFSGNFTGFFSNTFANFFSSIYNRFAAFSGQFIGSFSGSRTKFFTGTFSGTFTGFFTGSFTGLTVQNSTENVSNVTLWVRIA